MSIALIVRSWNRPEYLRQTIDSLLQSDINKCYKRIIYDDGSTDPETLQILKDSKLMNVPGKEFKVIFASHSGHKQSFLNAIDSVTRCEYICTIDNDMIVSPDFMTVCIEAYKGAQRQFRTNDILLTGFRPTNAHPGIKKEYPTFITKYSCGGEHYYFHMDFKGYMVRQWNRVTHGLCNNMIANKLPIVCPKQGVVQHIGKKGMYSNNNFYRNDSTFTN